MNSFKSVVCAVSILLAGMIVNGCGESENYLFNTPSKEDIAEWKSFCSENSKEIPESSKDIEAIDHVVYDILHYYYRRNDVEQDKKDDFVIWRLSRYIPVKQKISCEKERFDILDAQIDSVRILFGEKTYTSFELSRAFELGETFTIVKCGIVLRCLEKFYPKDYDLFVQEKIAFDEYFSAASDYFYALNNNELFSYFMIHHRWCDFENEIASIYEKSLEDFYFASSDGIYEQKEPHVIIRRDWINREYDNFANDVNDKKNVGLLRQDQIAFFKWIAARDAISNVLSGELQSIFDNTTNEIMRRKLIQLKNRYEGYGSISDDEYERLLKPESTDQELLGITLAGLPTTTEK